MQRHQPSVFGSALLAGLLSWAALELEHLLYTPDVWFFYGLASFAALLWFSTAVHLLRLSVRLIYRWWIKRPGDRAGTAEWASPKDAKKANLLKKRHGQGYLVGLLEKLPVWVDTESCGLVLSPAGGGKTTNFVIPALCHNRSSMLVADLKKTLAVMTAELRRKKLKHRIITVNPTGDHADILGTPWRYNPLQILIDDWAMEALHSFLLSDAHAIALQLYPEPTRSAENKFFRDASRKFLAFTFVYMVVFSKETPTLARALELLSDIDALMHALTKAMESNALSGDLARLATDLHTKLAKGDPKQIESFREGSVQVLEPFSPSGVLAESTSACDFRFRDMRQEKVTVYLMGDPTRADVMAPWMGLLGWCALTELIREQQGNRVVYLLDEITNFKIDVLPRTMTLAREFHIVIWLVVQELEEWVRVYGRESLETLLSQTEVKVIFGTRSHKTNRLISEMLGTTTVKATNYNLGASVFDAPTSSLSDASMHLMTPEQVRRCTDAIVFVREHKPMRLKKIGYQEVSPWKRWVGINPLYGKKYKARTKLRL